VWFVCGVGVFGVWWFEFEFVFDIVNGVEYCMDECEFIERFLVLIFWVMCSVWLMLWV